MMSHHHSRQLPSHATIFRAGEAPSESQNVPRSEKLKTSIVGIIHSALREFKEELTEGKWEKRRATGLINYYTAEGIVQQKVKGTINSNDTFEYNTEPLKNFPQFVMVRGIKGESSTEVTLLAYKKDVEEKSHKEQH